MPINVNTLYQAVMANSNTAQSGYLTPANFNLFVNQVNIELFNEKYLAFQKNQKITDDLSPFLNSLNIFATATGGGATYNIIPFPSNYTYLASARAFYKKIDDKNYSCKCPTAKDDGSCSQFTEPVTLPAPITEVDINYIDNNRWGAVLNHKRKCPTFAKPAYTEFSGGFKIAPKGLSIITLDYFNTPPAANWGYTIQNGYPVYNSGTSVNLAWGNQVFNEFCDRLCRLFSIAIRDPELFNETNVLKETRV